MGNYTYAGPYEALYALRLISGSQSSPNGCEGKGGGMGSFNSQSVNASRSRLESLSFRERERERFTTKKLSFKGRAFFFPLNATFQWKTLWVNCFSRSGQADNRACGFFVFRGGTRNVFCTLFTLRFVVKRCLNICLCRFCREI